MNTTTLDECISRMYPDTCGMPVDAKIWTIIFEGALASIASILGTIFNIASLVVLFDPPSRNLFEQLLISLAFCDLTFLSKLPYNIMLDIIISFYLGHIFTKNVIVYFITYYSFPSAVMYIQNHHTGGSPGPPEIKRDDECFQGVLASSSCGVEWIIIHHRRHGVGTRYRY